MLLRRLRPLKNRSIIYIYEAELQPFRDLIGRKTTKNYHPRADDLLLLKFADISVLRLLKEDEKP